MPSAYCTFERPSRQLKLLLELLKNHGDSDECLIWPGGYHCGGYGRICVEHARWLIHRFVYKLCNGRIYRDLLVMHTCDVRPCICPKHLRQGTDADNLKDMREKGRDSPPPHRFGEFTNNAKLTETDIREIRRRYQAGESQPSIAASYGVHRKTIGRITIGKLWKHVK